MDSRNQITWTRFVYLPQKQVQGHQVNVSQLLETEHRQILGWGVECVLSFTILQSCQFLKRNPHKLSFSEKKRWTGNLVLLSELGECCIEKNVRVRTRHLGSVSSCSLAQKMPQFLIC